MKAPSMQASIQASILLAAASLMMPLAVEAALPAQILIPGEQLFTESVTSSADGSVFVGSVGERMIFRASPGADRAQPWIVSDDADPSRELGKVFGVFADDRSHRLWACSRSTSQTPDAITTSSLHAFDLVSGKPKGRWTLPGPNSFCNDIAVGDDGSVYLTDTTNMEVLRLAPGAKKLETWAGDGAFGAKGNVLDGIAFVDGRVLVNTLSSGRLFSIAVLANGSAGTIREVQLDRPLDQPDGQRRFGHDLLVVESGGAGRLSKVVLAPDHASGRVISLREGFADGPVALTVVSETAYVVSAQFARKRASAKDPSVRFAPFRAEAVFVGRPRP